MQGTSTRKLGGLVAATALFIAQAVAADPTLQINGIALNPGANPADVVAATDQLMGSAIGKQATGRLLLLASMADGDNPATHSFAVLFKSAAAGEAFNQKLYADPAWAQFEAAMTKLGTVSSTARYRTIKSWGDISDNDVVWLGVALVVKDAPAFLAARDRYQASETGKKFPGQGHLSAVVAAGASPVTHIISVGYASEAEMESWGTVNRASADWQAYQTAAQSSAQVVGFTLSRVVKSWGPATMKDVAAP
jgi:hypothetical protein